MPFHRDWKKTSGTKKTSSNIRSIVRLIVGDANALSQTDLAYSENKIDLIEERLGGIEEVLHDLRASVSSMANDTPPPISSIRMNSIASCHKNTLDQHEAVTPFEGSSSFTAHSAYASQFLQSAVSESHIQISTPKINAALSTLKHLVSLQKTQPYSKKRGGWLPQRRVSLLQNLPLPPVDLVLRILREIKSTSTSVECGDNG